MISIQSTGHGATHNLQPVQKLAITECMCLAAPIIASNGQAVIHRVQPIQRSSLITAKYLLTSLAIAATYLTRAPGCAPSSGLIINKPDSSLLAANTIPSDKPNRILRGARLATITTNFPSKSSGA